MFYSHEILTNRKYGVATVWLVATLGAKSSAKKLSRKTITDVDLSRACTTIITPSAPMALRLQSNLMYGVTRVYSQQCDYVLHDAQAAQTAMRAMLRGKGGELDMVGPGRGRREALVLEDDPAFELDGVLALPALEMDWDGVGDDAGDGRSSQSLMSVRGRSGSVSSNSLPPLNLGSSSGNSIGYQLPFDDPFGDAVHKPYIGDDGGMAGEDMMFEDDMMFDIDDEGNMVDIPASERAARRASAHPQARPGSDSAASGRVRKEHEAATGRVLANMDADGDFDMFNYGEDEMGLPDAEAFPEGAVFMSGGLQGNDKAFQSHANLNDRVHALENPESDDPSSISAEAPLRRKPKEKKKIIADLRIELRNKDLMSFRDDYVENMAAASKAKLNHKATMHAKKNAFHFVYGTGILGIGEGIGFSKLISPLNIFSGDHLFSKITGELLHQSPAKHTKRAHSNDDEDQDPESKRARHAEEEIGRGHEHDDNIFDFNNDHEHEHDHSVELGRDAPSALPDLPSSAMPWNLSTSLRGASSKAASRRMTSASPLIGRGSVLPEQFDLAPLDDEDEILYGRSDDGASQSQSKVGRLASSSHAQGFASTGDEDEFEAFGPAANVDTQTAGTSQWVRQALDRESNNFFEYVRNTIDEKTPDEIGEEGEGSREKCVTFQELFNEEGNSAMVAAQAFYHVLCLATKRRVWVVQDEVEGEVGGEIRIGVVEVM